MFKIMKKIVNGVICHLLYQVRYENIEAIQKYEKCLICPNHSNIMDPVFLFPKADDLYFVAKSELFRNPLFSRILRHYQALPIIREKKDIKGMKAVMELFKNKEKVRLVIFPEGGIIKQNEKLRKVKNGAVHLAATLQIPIIPVSITIQPKLFSKVKIKVGEAIFIKKEVLEQKELIKQSSDQLLDAIYSLK